MSMTITFRLGVGLLVWLWLSVLATCAAIRDTTLEPFQKAAQIVIAWLIPIFGAVLALHLIQQHNPDAIPFAVPWPFRSLIASKRIARHQHRDNSEENAINLAVSRKRAQKLEAAREALSEDIE